MPETNDRPNVLLICTDHLSHRMTRSGGHPTCMTPTMAQLAQSGVTFDSCYSATPTCVPARRALMTGLSPRTHGMNVNGRKPMPDVPTMAQTFRDNGYQAYAVGKLHTFPQRSRLGFDDVILNEEGRMGPTGRDDWDQACADAGYAGQAWSAGMCNNDYMTRSWPLPDRLHPTNWAAEQMCRVIQRRDPQRPNFWYLSFTGPHPPLLPLQAYMDAYRDVPMDEPVFGNWSQNWQDLPWLLANRHDRYSVIDAPEHERQLGRRAFYATVTHIDHQIRMVVGFLRDSGLIDNTVVALTSDHGDLLGDHHSWAKSAFYEMAANVPLIIMPTAGCERMPFGTVDHRVAELRDIMPTLLDLAGVPIPEHVEGISLASDARRETLYGETGGYGRSPNATRMLRGERYKLIYHAAGNRFQLFDVPSDPRDQNDLIDSAEHADVIQAMKAQLANELYREDDDWLDGDRFVGFEAPPVKRNSNRNLCHQRGVRF